MSSSSQVRLAYIEETAYGETPGAGNFDVIRLNNETLSGTPSLNTSNEVRSDRQPTGQNLVGLDAAGNVTGNLAPTKWVTDFIEAALYDTWNAAVTTGSMSLDITTSGTKLTRASGSFVTDGFAVGDLIQLSGFTNSANNSYVYVSAVAALELTIVGASLVDESGGGDEEAKRHKYVEIGSDETSFSIAKSFLDLTSKGISYRGVKVDSMTVDLQARQDGTIAFGLAAGGADPYDPATDITDSRTVNAAGTEQALSGSANVGLIVVDGAAVGYCVGGFNLQLNNNHTARQCIGQLPPSGQDEGEAAVQVSLNAYLTDANFDLHTAKTDGSTIEIVFPIVTTGGEGYAFSVAAFKPSMADAQSGGKNQQVMLPISGVGEPTATRNALRVYHITQA